MTDVQADLQPLRDQIDRDGFAVCRDALNEAEVESARLVADDVLGESVGRRRVLQTAPAGTQTMTVQEPSY